MQLTPGEKILVLRRRKGILQEDLAKAARTSRITINAIERERYVPDGPGTDLFDRLAAVLDVPVTDLLEEK